MKPQNKHISIDKDDWDRIVSEPAPELSEECREIAKEAEKFFRLGCVENTKRIMDLMREFNGPKEKQ